MLLLAYHRIQQKTTMWRYECLNAEGRLRRNRSLPRPSLVDPSESPWARLYSSRNDQSLITVTGLDHDAFDHLLSMYKPYFDNFSPWTRTHEGTTFRRMKTSPDKRPGKKRIIMAHASLALVLTWYRFRTRIFPQFTNAQDVLLAVMVLLPSFQFLPFPTMILRTRFPI